MKLRRALPLLLVLALVMILTSGCGDTTSQVDEDLRRAQEEIAFLRGYVEAIQLENLLPTVVLDTRFPEMEPESVAAVYFIDEGIVYVNSTHRDQLLGDGDFLEISDTQWILEHIDGKKYVLTPVQFDPVVVFAKTGGERVGYIVVDRECGPDRNSVAEDCHDLGEGSTKSKDDFEGGHGYFCGIPKPGSKCHVRWQRVGTRLDYPGPGCEDGGGAPTKYAIMGWSCEK